MAKVLQAFLNADMRWGHDGLERQARAENIDVKNLEPGVYVVFINSAQDRIKLYASSNVVAYLKSPSGKLDMRAIALIPRAFEGSGRLDYDALLKEVLEQKLGRHEPKAKRPTVAELGVKP